MEAKLVKDSFTIMSEIVMPNDTNPLGNLMGGNLLKWMDVAAGICAARHADAAVVTAAVDNVSFRHPIRQGDLVTIETRLARAFNTSMEVYIEVFSENPVLKLAPRKSNVAYYTMVALDGRGDKVEVAPLNPETEKEKRLFEGALRRRELRLILAGRMKPGESAELRELFLGNQP